MAQSKDNVAEKERIVRDEASDRIAEVHADQHVTADHELAVQIPDEVSRDADQFEDTRTAPSPAEVFASQAKSSAKKSD